jgi:hypothetical protein
MNRAYATTPRVIVVIDDDGFGSADFSDFAPLTDEQNAIIDRMAERCAIEPLLEHEASYRSYLDAEHAP